MKRNWEIIREILIRLESSETPNSVVDARSVDGYPEQEVAYNIRLLGEGGYIQANIAESCDGDGEISAALACRLTHSGHELLDIMRSNSVWERIKDEFKKKGVEMTLSLVVTAGRELSRRLLS